MTIERNDLLPICGRLLAWAQATGGWQAPAWGQLRAAVERAEASPALATEAAPFFSAGCPRLGDRARRLLTDGVLDLAIPDRVTEEGADWNGRRDAAIQAALDDGRWLECTAVTDSEVGVLGDRGWLR